MYEKCVSIWIFVDGSGSMQAEKRRKNFECWVCGKIFLKLECGPMPNLMVALPNIGGALCSTPQFG